MKIKNIGIPKNLQFAPKTLDTKTAKLQSQPRTNAAPREGGVLDGSVALFYIDTPNKCFCYDSYQ